MHTFATLGLGALAVLAIGCSRAEAAREIVAQRPPDAVVAPLLTQWLQGRDAVQRAGERLCGAPTSNVRDVRVGPLRPSMLVWAAPVEFTSGEPPQRCAGVMYLSFVHGAVGSNRGSRGDVQPMVGGWSLVGVNGPLRTEDILPVRRP